MDVHELGKRLRERRLSLGLTQSEVARAFGVERVTIHQYEAGKRALRAVDLPRLAHILKCSVAHLYGEEAHEGAEDDVRPQVLAFYDDLTADGKDDLLAIAEAIWRRKRREETTHGPKPE